MFDFASTSSPLLNSPFLGLSNKGKSSIHFLLFHSSASVYRPHISVPTSPCHGDMPAPMTRRCQQQYLVLGKFGFKPIQTWFEPKPNQRFRFQFGDSCHETKQFGFGLGDQWSP